MKLACVLLIFSFSYAVHAQQFVHPANEWYTDDCCYAVGETHCTTYKSYFEGPVQIDGLEYYELVSSNPQSLFDFKGYYREENGRVFKRENENQAEYVIYDFKLVAGEQIEIGNSEYSMILEVLSVDSVTLQSGIKRKRLEVATADNPNNKTFWIEGIGSLSAPMDPLFMLSLDCWNDFNCFHTNDELEYLIGNCQLTTGTKQINTYKGQLSCYPNPVSTELRVIADSQDTFKQIEILDIRGISMLTSNSQNGIPFNIRDLSAGIYFARVTFENGQVGLNKFVKN